MYKFFKEVNWDDPELFAVPETPEAWTAPTNPAAERILQRHADLERLMKQLQPLPAFGRNLH